MVGDKSLIRNSTYTCQNEDYCAPEVLDPERRYYCAGSDWFAVGVIAYELLFGCLPFKSKNRAERDEKILTGEVEFPNYV